MHRNSSASMNRNESTHSAHSSQNGNGNGNGNGPIKSPSPDHIHANILTPTKIKVMGDRQKSHYVSGEVENKTKERDHSYIIELEKKVSILTIENNNLLKKINEAGSRKNTTVIEKIKEQYRENIKTMKLMIEHEVKQAIGVIEDMMEITKHRMSALEAKVQAIQQELHEIKVRQIMSTDSRNRHASPSRHIHEHSIEDILCVSIPQEEWEQSKNYSLTISKLQDEIDKLKKTIDLTQQAYRKQKSSLESEIKEKDEKIKNLSSQTKQNWSPNFQIKQQLLLLQSNINEIAQELLNSQSQYSQALVSLEEKSGEIQMLTREILILRDKVVGQQRHRMMLEEKTKFLENNIELYEHQLKERKKMLEQLLISKMQAEKQRIHKHSETSKSEASIMTLTARIDKLLQLQEERVCLST